MKGVGVSPLPAPGDHSFPLPLPSFPFLQNKHPRAQTTHPAKAQMELELELINPVARATRTGQDLAFSLSPPSTTRPHPCLTAPPIPGPGPTLSPCLSWWFLEGEDEDVHTLGSSPYSVLLAWWELGQVPEPPGATLCLPPAWQRHGGRCCLRLMRGRSVLSLRYSEASHGHTGLQQQLGGDGSCQRGRPL